MKIAIASEGNSVGSLVSSIGGRAPYYLFFENGVLINSIKNPFLSGGGAGFSVASLLADETVDLVICQEFGEKMIGALEEKSIQCETVDNMTVEEALKKTGKIS